MDGDNLQPKIMPMHAFNPFNPLFFLQFIPFPNKGFFAFTSQCLYHTHTQKASRLGARRSCGRMLVTRAFDVGALDTGPANAMLAPAWMANLLIAAVMTVSEKTLPQWGQNEAFLERVESGRSMICQTCIALCVALVFH